MKDIIVCQTQADVDEALTLLEKHTAQAMATIAELSTTPLQAMQKIKFEAIGVHPMEDRPLNFIEQVNQTFTYYTALKASEFLLKKHPQAGGFTLAPGAYAPKKSQFAENISLDIESIVEGVVGAEVFASVNPNNMGKLNKDLKKMRRRLRVAHRYVFFMSPKFPRTGRLEEKDKGGVQVYSIAPPYS